MTMLPPLQSTLVFRSTVALQPRLLRLSGVRAKASEALAGDASRTSAPVARSTLTESELQASVHASAAGTAALADARAGADEKKHSRIASEARTARPRRTPAARRLCDAAMAAGQR